MKKLQLNKQAIAQLDNPNKIYGGNDDKSKLTTPTFWEANKTCMPCQPGPLLSEGCSPTV
jgi:hypothetical protein